MESYLCYLEILRILSFNVEDSAFSWIFGILGSLHGIEVCRLLVFNVVLNECMNEN